MKMRSTVAWSFLLGCAFAQTQSGSPKTVPQPQTDQQNTAPTSRPAAQSSKIDPAKAADIRQLMDVTEVKAVMTQMMDSMGDKIKPLLAKALPAGEYREKLVDLFFAKFKSKADPQQLWI